MSAAGRFRIVLAKEDFKFSCAHFTVFAEGLSFPTSIAPWKDGVFVTAPPQILYLADRDGDRRADLREVVYDGFTLGVTDSNVNGLRWAIDNRIHGANGGNGGQVGKTALRGLDFRFDPRTRAFETTYHTAGGFGLVRGTGPVSFEGGLVVAAHTEADEIVGTVRNDLPFAVRRAAVFLGRAGEALGMIEPGEEVRA